MIRAYKFRLRPTTRQAQALTEMLRDHCSLYNGALQERRDAYRHSSANALIRDNDAIACERLNIAGMTRTPEPRPGQVDDGAFLPNGAAAKAGLNRSILDAGWGQFLRILANKAESAGRLVIPVDARNTSRTCPVCGYIAKENRITQSRFECVSCGFTANADHVGALNIRNRAGPALCDADPSAA
ncbi:transposase [Streptomyces puniciscabiei]|uniref:transposase n=1 Tax=Streptomyces puniciscabiei TaxID=164348 RepID=UPI0033201D8D